MASGWEADLLKYLAQSDVKASMHSFVVDARKRGVRFGGGAGGTVDDEQQAQQRVEKEIIPKLIAIVREIIPSMTENMFLKMGKPSVNAEGAYVFTLNFDPKTVHRPSLYRKKYDGIDNIVAYVAKGAKPLSHSVYGMYVPYQDGARSTPRRYYIPKGYKREDKPWLEAEVNMLNGELRDQGIEIVLGPEYRA